MRHYSDIHRVSQLALSHPLVGSVMLHNIKNKNIDDSEFDEKGRATQCHQSPWDLNVTLAASGVRMHVGCTVNRVADDLLAFWWKPVDDGWTEKLKSIGEAVFFDITEIEHLGLTTRGNVVVGVAANEKNETSLWRFFVH